MNSGRGWFITLEGPEGAGKSSQIEALRQFLLARDRDVVLTREPGGTPLSEELRDLVKHYRAEQILPQTELLLFAAARAQHVAHVIRPALEAGKIVLCDRFYDSTEAYQGAGRAQDAALVAHLRDYVCGDLRPDITFLLDLDPAVGLARAAARRGENHDVDRLEREKLEFHRRVRAGFLAIAKREPERVVVISADAPRARVTEAILAATAEKLQLSK